MPKEVNGLLPRPSTKTKDILRSSSSSQRSLILFAILYIVVFFGTLRIHNVHKRSYLQLYGPIRNEQTKKKGNRLIENIRARDVSRDRTPASVSAIKKTLLEGNDVIDGKTITSILRGELEFPLATESTTNKSSSNGLRFQPGTINLTQSEVLRHCYADPNIYAKHFPSSDRQVTSVSDKYKLVYILVPKSGSSTGRWIMDNILDAHDAGIDPAGNELHTTYGNYTVITFVRDPLSRFYSQYDEAFLRFGPWMKNREGRMWKGMKNFQHPYPYIYENMTTWEDYQDAFCPPESIPSKFGKKYTKHWCSRQETHENGTLALRFERFVQDYDGLQPWDMHLHLQVPHISNKYTGRTRRVDEVYNTNTAATIGNWEYVVNWYGQSLPTDGVFDARSVPRRFNTSLVSISTKQRICQQSAIDYCCLNMELPPECRNDEKVEIHCSLDHNKLGEFRIQPWQQPH